MNGRHPFEDFGDELVEVYSHADPFTELQIPGFEGDPDLVRLIRRMLSMDVSPNTVLLIAWITDYSPSPNVVLPPPICSVTRLSERTRRCTSPLRESSKHPDRMPRTDPLLDLPPTSDTSETPRDAALFAAEGVPGKLLILTKSSLLDTLAARPNDRAPVSSVVLAIENRLLPAFDFAVHSFRFRLVLSP